MSDAVFVNTGALYSKSDLQEYKRKLRNKIVFTQPLCDVEPLFKALAVRPSVAGRTRLYGRG